MIIYVQKKIIKYDTIVTGFLLVEYCIFFAHVLFIDFIRARPRNNLEQRYHISTYIIII